jgi:ketosteroid isomerase-like protein
MRIVGLMLVFFAIAALAKGAPKPTAQDLIKADDAFGKVTAEKGLDGWLSFFDFEAVIFPRSKPPIKGLEPIKAHYEEVGFTPEGLTWTPLGAEIAASGDLGYTYGTSVFKGKDKDGKAVTITGKYLTTWKRQKDGRWKVLADIGTSDPAKS